jgi:hypothetical protein
MRLVAQLSDPAAHLVHGALVTSGFLVPGLILIRIIDRAEQGPSQQGRPQTR